MTCYRTLGPSLHSSSRFSSHPSSCGQWSDQEEVKLDKERSIKVTSIGVGQEFEELNLQLVKSKKSATTPNETLVNIAELGGAAQAHRLHQLLVQDAQHIDDALLAIRTQTPEHWAAHEHATSTQSKC